MTREEASFILANIDRRVCDDELNEALDMAIEVLDQEPCEDCISREEVCDYIAEFVNHEYATDREHEMVENIIGGIQHLSSIQPKPKTEWIPVSERFPESSGVYIVSRWFSDGEESAILVDANYYDGNGDWYNDNRINWGRDLVTDKIVAWMPLPEPYKPTEKE